ncbi:MAG: ATP-binding response regulator [Planctomycetaceae bacterium]
MSRILLIDDNPDNLYSLRLQLDGFEVIEAGSGPEGLELARTKSPDCILLDVQMPGMDGFQVCRALRAGEVTRGIPVILVTAHSKETESVVRGLAAGGDDYVTKPVAQQELLARVRAMLRIRDLQGRLEHLNADLEREVRGRTAELRQIYATVPVGIYTLDPLGRVASFNLHLERLLGYSAGEVIGKLGIGDLFGPDYDALYWLDLCRREGRCSTEGQARRKDGTLVPVFDERVVNRDKVGEPSGFTGYMQDITRERRVRELLAEQEKQAGVGRLAAGIVHEISNPIAGVTLYLDSMLARLEAGEPLPRDEVRRGVGVMRDALARTSDLLGNLRGMSRNALRPHTDVDLLALLRDLHALMRGDLHRRGIRMEVRGEAVRVRGDPGRLAQVFLNLLTNARDAMAGGGRIDAEVAAQDSAARVVFRDTGTGIDPAILPRIFEFLFTTKGEAGTGYGLALAREIVEQHGGEITVRSEPGHGAEFTVTLPLGPSGTHGTPVAGIRA